MNRQAKKQWLRQAWNLAATIDYCEWLITDPSVYSSPGFGERVDTGRGNGEESKVAGKLAEIDRAVRDRDRAVTEMEKRKEAINRLTDATLKKILWLRYIKHYSWNDVCLVMNYSRSRCNELHNQAVDRLQIL